MASENIDIRVREDGARVVKRSIQDIGDAGIKSASGIDMLKRALGGLSVGIAVAQFTRMLDVTTNINNRLRLVTNTTDELNAVYGELLKISNETRTGLEANADLFNRVAQGTKSMNMTYREQLDFVRQLNMALQISGASAEGGAAAMYQLGQALATGTLRGEEFNSINENASRIMDALAASMGVPRGALRDLAAEGKITAEALVQAMSDANTSLEAEFAKIAPTIAGAFTVLNNQALDFVRNFNEGTAIGEIFAMSILFVAENFEIFAAGAAALAVILVGSLIPSFIALTAAMLTNPIGIIAVAIGAALVALAAFGSTQIQIAGQTATVWQVVKAAIMTVVDVVVMAYETVVGLFNGMTTVSDPFFQKVMGWIQSFVGWWVDAASMVLGVIKTMINTQVGLFVGLVNAVGPVITEGIPALFKTAMAIAVNFVITGVQNIINIFAKGLGAIGSALDYIPGFEGAGAAIEGALTVDFSGMTMDVAAYRAELEGAGAAISSAFGAAQVDYVGAVGDAIASVGDSIGTTFSDNLAEVTAATTEGAAAADLLNNSLGGGTGTGGLAGGLGNAGGAAGGAAKGVSDMNDQLERQKQILEETQGKRQEFVDQLQAVSTLLASGQITQGDALSQMMGAGALNEDLFTGTQELLAMRVEQFRLMYEQIDALRQADVISEQTAAQAKKQIDLLYMEERLSGQKALFGELAKLSRSENRTLAAIGKAAAVTQATIDGYLAIQKALASYPPPINYAIAAAIGATTAANVASILSTNTNFATGGSFVVPGTGGVDSQLVAMRASPGERVTVQTPSQVRHGSTAANSGGGDGGGATVQNSTRIVNVIDPALLGDYMATPEGETLVMNTIRRNSDQMRSMLTNG